jgi:hypothetical protein
VFDYAAQDRVYQELHALAQQNGTGIAAPVNVSSSEPPKTKVMVASKKSTAKTAVDKKSTKTEPKKAVKGKTRAK